MKIWVYSEEFDNVPLLMGCLTGELLRGKELFSFEYCDDWLKDKHSKNIDPDLSLYNGRQYPSVGKMNFGLFLDSTPDRWGRLLLDRREVLRAREEKRPIRPLREWDYLLGVFDGSRMGALRFKIDPDGPFLDNDSTLASPPWTSLRELENASLQLEQDKEMKNSRWLTMLLQPGSSLGGARPKANVVDSEGNLWIAKFPSRMDTKDIGAWEWVCMQLARHCGIIVSNVKAERLGCEHHTFLTRRFDRNGTNHRIHFVSAMTLLGYCDGASGSDGVSYLELVEWIETHCADVQANLDQLFRRIVFNIAISNCDDHLRNHGFLLTDKGWNLSPAYDLTPDVFGTGLKLNITENDNSLDMNLVREVAPYFGIHNAENIITDVRAAVEGSGRWHGFGWRNLATRIGISRYEQDQMASAFSH